MKNTDSNHSTLTVAIAEPLYDLSMLEEMDDTEYLLEMLAAVLHEVPKDLTEMQQALKAGDTDILCKTAHKLKSSAGVIQAEKLITLLENIEALGKKSGITNELTSLVENVAQQYAHIEKALKNYTAALK